MTDFSSSLEVLFKDQSTTFIAVDTNDLKPLLVDIEELYAQGKMYIRSNIKNLVSTETADKLFFIELLCKNKKAYQRQIYPRYEIDEIIKKANRVIEERKSMSEKALQIIKSRKRHSFGRNYPFGSRMREMSA